MSRRRRREGPDGVALVDKPAGPTSAEVVDWMRWSLGGVAVGHCGTLDPGATGLLVVCVGAATKLAAILTDADKRYRATVVFGRSTTTADADGETVAECPCPPDLGTRAVAAVPELEGPQMLPPPAFSAIKVDGRRAHALARAGDDVRLEPRPMVVREALVRGPQRADTIEADFLVSKGTYIRSLAVELGRRLGVPAHLGALRRLGAGAFGVGDRRTLRGFSVVARGPDPRGKPRHRLRLDGVEGDRASQAAAIEAGLLDPREAVPLPRIAVPDDDAGADLLRRLLHGQAVAASHAALAAASGSGPVAVIAQGPRALILAQWEGEAQNALLRPTRVVLAP